MKPVNREESIRKLSEGRVRALSICPTNPPPYARGHAGQVHFGGCPGFQCCGKCCPPPVCPNTQLFTSMDCCDILAVPFTNMKFEISSSCKLVDGLSGELCYSSGGLQPHTWQLQHGLGHTGVFTQCFNFNGFPTGPPQEITYQLGMSCNVSNPLLEPHDLTLGFTLFTCPSGTNFPQSCILCDQASGFCANFSNCQAASFYDLNGQGSSNFTNTFSGFLCSYQRQNWDCSPSRHDQPGCNAGDNIDITVHSP